MRDTLSRQIQQTNSHNSITSCSEFILLPVLFEQVLEPGQIPFLRNQLLLRSLPLTWLALILLLGESHRNISRSSFDFSVCHVSSLSVRKRTLRTRHMILLCLQCLHFENREVRVSIQTTVEREEECNKSLAMRRRLSGMKGCPPRLTCLDTEMRREINKRFTRLSEDRLEKEMNISMYLLISRLSSFIVSVDFLQSLSLTCYLSLFFILRVCNVTEKKEAKLSLWSTCSALRHSIRVFSVSTCVELKLFFDFHFAWKESLFPLISRSPWRQIILCKLQCRVLRLFLLLLLLLMFSLSLKRRKRKNISSMVIWDTCYVRWFGRDNCSKSAKSLRQR